MFTTDSFGRLEYAPFETYSLPEICYVEANRKKGTPLRVEFARRGKDTDGDGFGPPSFYRNLSRLHWPGEYPHGLPLPSVVSNSIPIQEGVRHLDDIWANWNGVTPLPLEIAYHSAVNYHSIIKRFPDFKSPPVAGLPANRVRQVLDARFALDDHAWASLDYLKWTAESHHGHKCPFLNGFDTNVRETLYGLQHEAVRLFFYLIGDYRYDVGSRWYDRGLGNFEWYRCATYLHWVGRTGRALYGRFSHIDPAEGIAPQVVGEKMQDVVDGNDKWLLGICGTPDDEPDVDMPVPQKQAKAPRKKTK